MIIGLIYLVSFLLLFWFFLLSTLALVICAENSFWAQKSTFLDAFSDALQLYQNSGTRKKVEAGLHQLGSYPQDTKGKHAVLQYFSKSQDVREEAYKTALIDLILAHCLGISKISLLSFFNSCYWQPNPQPNDFCSCCINIYCIKIWSSLFPPLADLSECVWQVFTKQLPLAIPVNHWIIRY